MEVIRDAHGLKNLGGCVLVPTMGALHDGHARLISHAADLGRERSAAVVVSVFVNPTQFNEAHDFEKYPRDLERDIQRSAEAGATHVFAPGVGVMYPEGAPGGAGRTPAIPSVADGPMLEDHYRPGHFKGVCQVCLRLFEITDCGVAVFGEKDWQQLQAVRALVMQQGLDVEVVPSPTVRERDGLAMSSRNRRLSPADRVRAVALSRALEAAGTLDDVGEAEGLGVEILRASGVRPEYFAIRDAQTLMGVRPGMPMRALVAGRVGGVAGSGGGKPKEGDVRLIDNAPWPGFVRGG